MKKVLFVGLILGLFLSGCSSKGISISKCSVYEDGICVNSNIEYVIFCDSPMIIDEKTYCKEK